MPQTRTVIVCLPAGEPADWFSASEILDWHHLPTGTPHPYYPIRHRRLLGWLTRWSQRHLVAAVRRFGAVTRAAGGRRSRLDLTTAAAHANTQAAARWRSWNQVVAHTPQAKPWAEFHAQHQTNPAKVSMEEAVRRFEAQPRVLAMLTYNLHPVSRSCHLDPYDLDAYQAGAATYTALHWQKALAGDAMITSDGKLLEPATASLADQLRYLAEAGAHLRTLHRRHHLLAVTIPT
jgi:hypothetical protein